MSIKGYKTVGVGDCECKKYAKILQWCSAEHCASIRNKDCDHVMFNPHRENKELFIYFFKLTWTSYLKTEYSI